jgi:hypothetical protein
VVGLLYPDLRPSQLQETFFGLKTRGWLVLNLPVSQ